MRNRMGVLAVVLGVACLLGAVGLVVYNRWESDNAAKVSQTLLEDVQKEMDITDGDQTEGATIDVQGYECIGILSIPTLDVTLPVLDDWSYAKLKLAPCRYYGSCNEKDFVIAAHNYPLHFGNLSHLQAGDSVVFTDANGVAHPYEVVLLETLPAEATETMIASGFDLSLYTCTPSGGSRVTVRCTAVTA